MPFRRNRIRRTGAALRLGFVTGFLDELGILADGHRILSQVKVLAERYPPLCLIAAVPRFGGRGALQETSLGHPHGFEFFVVAQVDGKRRSSEDLRDIRRQ